MKKRQRTGKTTALMGSAIMMCVAAGCGNTDGNAEDTAVSTVIPMWRTRQDPPPIFRKEELSI